MVRLIKADFNGEVIQFNDDGWFNATVAAKGFNKRVGDFLDLSSTKEYVQILNTRYSGNLIASKKGKSGGTWLHPKLAITFARWCSMEFSVWCDEQIEIIIHGEPNKNDWDASRHQAVSSFKVMQDVLKDSRAEIGKDTKAFHYANEAKLVNWAITGKFEKLDRESLSVTELDLLAALESRNAVLIARGVDRDTRKEILSDMSVIKLNNKAPKG